MCVVLLSPAFFSRPKIATHSVRLYNTSKHAATRWNAAIQCCQREHTATMVSLWRLVSGLLSWSLSHSPHSLVRSKTGKGAPVLNRNRSSNIQACAAHTHIQYWPFTLLGNFAPIDNFSRPGSFAWLGNFAPLGSFTQLGPCPAFGSFLKRLLAILSKGMYPGPTQVPQALRVEILSYRGNMI